jgi:hypothetical protein
MSITSSHDRSRESQAAAGPGRGPAAPTAGPGKRTLTEDLGAGHALPDAQRARFEQSATGFGSKAFGVIFSLASAHLGGNSRVGLPSADRMIAVPL